MDKSQVLNKASKYAEIVRKNFDPEKVVLYGSYTRENWKEESDIDIAVIVKRVEGDFLEKEKLLYRLRRYVDIRIEPILLEESSDRSGFLKDVLEHGRIIYSAER